MTLVPLMNDTKWDELRLAMDSIKPPPRWRTRIVETGYLSDWDTEWYYHFRLGGYDDIEWIEIRPHNAAELPLVIEALQRIHVPGRVGDGTVIVLGYCRPGEVVEYIGEPARPAN